jgi:hypothetical protein
VHTGDEIVVAVSAVASTSLEILNGRTTISLKTLSYCASNNGGPAKKRINNYHRELDDLHLRIGRSDCLQAVGFCKCLNLVVDVRRFSESTNHEDGLYKSANHSHIILAAVSHQIRCMKTYFNLDLAAETSLAHLFLKELIRAT